MKFILSLSLLCIHTVSVPPQQAKQKVDTLKKISKPVKVNKATAPLYPSFLIVNTY